MTARTAISIGSFDGVHVGHAALVRAGREAVGRGGRVVALSFEPHPVAALRPSSAPPRLTRFSARERLLADAGADEVVALEPTPELLALPAEAFLADLVERWQPAAIVEGPDFRFGRGRAGSIATLRALAGTYGYEAIIVGEVDVPLASRHLVRASSTMVRWLLSRGRVRDAATMLGRAYEIDGPVTSGDRRGRTIGVPTANLDHGDLLLPAEGIYAGHGRGPDGRWYPAAISVGTKPTFGTHACVCETHLVGYEGETEAYGWTLRVRFEHWLRDQVRYDDVDGLLAQIGRDVARTSALSEVGA